MKFTLSWLKKHLSTTQPEQKIIDKLSAIGLEVEESHNQGAVYEPFIIAEIKISTQHPDADKLKVCTVYNGLQDLQIVCGAPNARAGIKVVLAPVGAIIPNGEFKIKASKIRGVESKGMMCSANELNIGEEDGGIIELPLDAPVGQKYSTYASLDDTTIDIGLTPNRGDCASVRGIARDLAAADMGQLLEQNTINLQQENTHLPIKVNISCKELCSEFSIRYISNVDNTVVPDVTIHNYLNKIGSSPKSALVEISNFAMFDQGRPNHFYDADKLDGDITVRLSLADEPFVAIGGDEYKLPEGLMVVTDKTKVLAVAGVIGGELSKVTEDTKNIIVEVANFDPIAIAKSGRALNIFTDSRFRFERRVDFSNTTYFMDYITDLVQSTCGGACSKVLTCSGKEVNYIEEIEFDHSSLKKIAGFELDTDKINDILINLGFTLNGNKIQIPPARQGDIICTADIVEEIVRVHGFDNIESTHLPFCTPFIPAQKPSIKKILMARGLYETIHWSFYSQNDHELFGNEGYIELSNPISSDLAIMRNSMIPQFLNALARNMVRGNINLGFFETGAVFNKEHPNHQQQVLSGIRIGKLNPDNVHEKSRDVDFFDVKEDVYSTLTNLGLNTNSFKLDNSTPSYYHPGKSVQLFLGKKLIAYIGQLDPKVTKAKEIDSDVFCFEIFLDNLPPVKNKAAKPKLILSQYQAIKRDFAFIIDNDIPALNIDKSIQTIDKSLIQSIDIFDIYTGKGIADGKKSIALSVTIQSNDKTLKDEEINDLSDKIITKITNDYQAELRG